MRLPFLLLTVFALAGTLTAQQPCAAEVLPMHHLRLRSSVDGRVASIPVQVGQKVTAGEVLLTLDSPRLRAAVAAAEAALHESELAIEVAQLDQAIAEQQILICERDLKIASERLPTRQESRKAAEAQLANREVLYQAGRVSVADVQQARIEMARAEEDWRTVGEQVKSLQQQVTIGQLRVKRAELDRKIAVGHSSGAAAELELARQDLAEASLRAPFAATVARVSVVPGQLLDARSTVAVELVDLTRVRLRFRVPVPAAHALAVGQGVEVALAGERLAATIASVDPLLDPATRTRGAEVVIDNADGAWLAGTTVMVTLP